MKNFRLLLLSVLGVLAITASCSKSSTNDTWHPSQSMVTVVTDWGASEYAWWTNYTIQYKETSTGVVKEQTGTARVQDLPLQNPGNYDLTIFNRGPGFNYQNDVLTVEESSPGVIFSSPAELAYMYTGHASVTAVKDQNIQVPVTMTPHIRRLSIKIWLNNDPIVTTPSTPSGSRFAVSSVEATMTGVANTYNIKTGVYGNTAYTVSLPLQPFTDTNSDKRYLGCDLNMLGITGNDQTINLRVQFEGGPELVADPKNYNLELTAADFNNLASYTLTGAVDMSMIVSGNVTIEEYEDGGSEDLELDESAYTYAIFDRYPNVNIAADPQGIVVWTTPDGRHGLVLGGEEANVTWAPTADLGAATYNPYLYGPWSYKIMDDYLNSHPSADMGAVTWIRGTYPGETSWFLPSPGEIDKITTTLNMADVQTALSTYGFVPLSGVYWTSSASRTIIQEDPLPVIPAKILTWDASANTYAEDDAVVDPEVTGSPLKTHNARAMRFF